MLQGLHPSNLRNLQTEQKTCNRWGTTSSLKTYSEKEETYPPFHLVLDARCFKPSIVSRVLCSVEPVDDHVKFTQHFSYSLLDSFEHKMFYFVFKENKTGGRGRVVCCREEAKTQPYE
jgi:hypothetical protein